MGRISVIIPTYNRADLLSEAIKAVQTQSYPVHQIVVVDDGSTDGTRAIVSALCGPIQYVYQPNAGKSAALNNGLGYCSGDFIWICDDDDLALPNAAEVLVNALESNHTAGLSFGRYKRFCTEPTGTLKISEPLYWPDLESNTVLVSLLEDSFIFQNACLVRREAYDAVGPFRVDLMRSQDYEMAIRLARRFNAAYVPEVVFMQREHEGLRGSSRERFGSTKKLEHWLHYDKMIFRDLYEAVPLSEYGPRSLKASDSNTARRGALLQRACLFFRKQLFDYSFADMREAISMSDGGGISATEERICERCLHPNQIRDVLLGRSDVADSLYSLAAGSKFGESVVKAITVPLLWHSRQAVLDKRWDEGRRLVKLLLRAHGYAGTLALLRVRFGRRLKLSKT